jgi:hypothetical protein
MLGGSLLGSLFGKKPGYDPAQRMQLDIARQLQAFAQGVPGSDPQEQAALAQMRGQLGIEQGQATNAILGALPGYARTNVADLMKNLAGSQASERSSLDMQALMEALNRRRQALLQAAQVAGSVGPKQGGHQSDLPAMFGQLAYQQAMQKAMKQPGAAPPAAQGAANYGVGPWGMGGGYKPAAPAAPGGAPVAPVPMPSQMNVGLKLPGALGTPPIAAPPMPAAVPAAAPMPPMAAVNFGQLGMDMLGKRLAAAAAQAGGRYGPR